MRRHLFLCLISLFLLGGCSNAVKTYRLNYLGGYNYQDFRYYTKDRALFIDIQAAPVPKPHEAFSETVQAAVQRASVMYGVETSTKSGDKTTSKIKLALHFAPQKNWSGNTICQPERPQRDKPKNDTTIVILAAYCVRGSAYSTIWGEIPNPAGPDDPRVADLITFMTRRLFPVHDPDRESNCPKVSPLMCG